MPDYIIPIDETRAIRFKRVGEPIVGKPQMYELLKPDGTRSGSSTFDAISRLQGHLGGRIVKAGEDTR